MDRREALEIMIQEYRKKVETYEAMISEWERELGRPPQPMNANLNPKGESNREEQRAKTPGSDPISLVRDYQFFGKTQPEAARMFLELVGHPLKTEQIMDGIEKGGVTVGGQNKQKKITNFYTILGRSKDFAIVRRGIWGLTSWPGVVKKENDTPSDENPETDSKPTEKP